MRVLCIFNVVFLVFTWQTVSFALPKKRGHRHHDLRGNHQKKSQMATSTAPSTTNSTALNKIFQNAIGTGWNFPSSFPDWFKLGKGQGRNLTTKTKTSTKVDKGYKTVTTITETFEKNENGTLHKVGESVNSVTTPVNSSTTNSGTNKANAVSSLDYWNPFGSTWFRDDPEPQCSAKKPCKQKGTYCDEEEGECKLKVKLNERCDQADQCAGEGEEDQKIACVWGRCTLLSATAGHLGMFCKKDSECRSREMYCAPQADVSLTSNVCVQKLAEGQTCGRRLMFDFWPIRRPSHDLPCKKGLACVIVGYSGRKICRSAAFLHDNTEDGEWKIV